MARVTKRFHDYVLLVNSALWNLCRVVFGNSDQKFGEAKGVHLPQFDNNSIHDFLDGLLHRRVLLQ